MPEIIIVKNEAEAGEIYGRCVADLIKAKPNAVLGLATGSSPLAAYQALAKIVHDESIDISQVSGYALDEYIGLPLTHPESYHATIHRTVVEPLGLDPSKVHVPGDVLNGAPLEDGDISAFCPASALQMHPLATIIVDEEAASRLRHKDYYRYAYTHKPAWQGI